MNSTAYSQGFMRSSLIILLTLLVWITPSRGAETTAVETLTLSETWRAGGDDSDVIFGLISQVLTGPDGNLYLLDSQLSEISVFDPQGAYLRTISRQGEGPGEIQRAGTMLLMPDGSLGVVQRFPSRIVMITTDGQPAGTIIPGNPIEGGRESLNDAKVVGADLILSGSRNTRVDNSRLSHNYLARFDAQGQLLQEYLTRDDKLDFDSRSFKEADEYFLFAGLWDISGDGNIYAAADRDAYRVSVFPVDGGAAWSFSHDSPLRQRPAARLEILEQGWKASRRYQRFHTEQVFAATEPAITRIVVRGDEIWVLPASGQHDQPAGILQTWDVFRPDGRFARQVRIAADGDGFRDRLFFTADDRIVIVAGFRDALDAMRGVGTGQEFDEEDAAPVTVIAYTIVQE